MKPIYIAIGANLSNPKDRLIGLPSVLERKGIHVTAASSLWRNPAWPEGMGYPDYLNGVLEVNFDGTAVVLLELLLKLEAEAGRKRSERNAPRPLDLDILDFRDEHHQSPDLILPHPRLHDRAFVLLPLAEIAPHWRHPKSGKSALELLAQLPLSSMGKMQFETSLSV